MAPRSPEPKGNRVLIEQTVARESAAGAVEEANAAIGACLSTGESSAAVAALLRGVQDGLVDIADAVRRQHDPRAVERRLRELCDSVPPLTARPTRSLTAGHSLAAGLIRLARTVVQRACREVTALGDDAAPGVREYLSALPDVLDSVAAELDADERRAIPLGICGQA